MRRSIDLSGATNVGISAIVGGGILVLAGDAFAVTGPSAIIAFAFNGILAFITAMSFAEMGSTFPESGGTYTYAKKVLTVEAAFSVGWVLLFASLVASVLYAIGFASFFALSLQSIIEELTGYQADFLSHSLSISLFALLATAWYGYTLTKGSSESGKLINYIKMLVFVFLIAGGTWAIFGMKTERIVANLNPFFSNGGTGLLQAMGYTFIAMHGFDLITAIGGEIKDPGKTIPKAMMRSLSVALAIYIPLLFVVSISGPADGDNIRSMAMESPEATIPNAARNFLGPTGFILVLIAGIASMLSALQANVYAASRIAYSMAQDRTLPQNLNQIDQKTGIPQKAVFVCALVTGALIIILPDVASAGAASSLIFLISFALAHGICILARHRAGKKPDAYHVPFFPYLPAAGAALCIALAVFQGVVVPAAGLLTAVWLGLGGFLYWFILQRRAQTFDASAEFRDAELLKFRGRSPLVLVPISNPANVEHLVGVANALAPPSAGRTLLLSIAKSPKDLSTPNQMQELHRAAQITQDALRISYQKGLQSEALTTVDPEPWNEILRVSKLYNCETVLLGLNTITDDTVDNRFIELLNSVHCHVVGLKTIPGWQPETAKRILVPTTGKSDHSVLRARLLAAFSMHFEPQITYLQAIPATLSPEHERRIRRELHSVAIDEGVNNARLLIERTNDIAKTLLQHAQESDLVIMGMPRFNAQNRTFTPLITQMAQEISGALMLIRHKNQPHSSQS